MAGVAVSPDHYIGGRRVASARAASRTISPIDQSLLAEVARAGADEVDQAVRAAHDAFPAWAALGPAGRAPYLHRLADLIDANVERLAAVECADMAMLLRSLRARVIARGARNYRAYADLAVAYEERDWRSNGTWNRVQRMPAGPGRGDHAVERAVHALDLEDGAGARGRAAPSCSSPPSGRRCRARCSPTSPTRPGCRPACSTSCRGSARRRAPRSSRTRCCAASRSPARPRPAATSRAPRRANLVPFTAELGGKNPFVVFADADLDAAARKAAGQYDDAGQVCLAGTRLLVEESVRDEFLERFDAAVDEHVLGDPRDDATTVSPMIHPDHVARVEGFVERARASGQEILRGGAAARRPVLRADADRARPPTTPRSSSARSSGRC